MKKEKEKKSRRNDSGWLFIFHEEVHHIHRKEKIKKLTFFFFVFFVGWFVFVLFSFVCFFRQKEKKKSAICRTYFILHVFGWSTGSK